MGLLRLGALSVILSDTLVSAFSTGCSIHVATSQLNSLFDIRKPNPVIVGPFKLIYVSFKCEFLHHLTIQFKIVDLDLHL